MNWKVFLLNKEWFKVFLENELLKDLLKPFIACNEIHAFMATLS